jgi:hypothetical protein
MKRIVKMYDYAIHVLQNNASIVMAIGSNEAWRDDCLNAVELLRAVRRKSKESRPTVRAKRPAQQAKVKTVTPAMCEGMPHGSCKGATMCDPKNVCYRPA